MPSIEPTDAPDAETTSDSGEFVENPATLVKSTSDDVEPATNRRVSVRLSTVSAGAAALVAVILLGALGTLLWQARGELSDRDTAAADRTHAEQVATSYAVGAATVNYQDFPAWISKLKANTAPALAAKFDATAPKLQEVLTPLKWTSTATPITAKVMTDNDGVYTLAVFLNVGSTNAQTQDSTQTTVTYSVTVDRKSGWVVTDVGGATGALPLR